ncbi:SNF2-family ATP dependent chromatin remodeling factor snf21 [Flagelloscypha sp. PMI_526]|nr:SNF2-family ATP dependent chromatin remodeling factor snf21 [Flagelloscypha sp. PMI_526]
MAPGHPSGIGQMLTRHSFLQANPHEAKPGELEQLQKFLQMHQQNQLQQHPQQFTSHLTNGHNGGTPTHPQSSTSPVSFTPDQITTLHMQIQAFKALQAGQPVPDYVLSAMKGVPATAAADKVLNGGGTDGEIDRKLVESVVKTVKAVEESINPEDMPKGPFFEDKRDSGVYPYNAYRDPYSHFVNHDLDRAPLFRTRLQKLIVPTVTPLGLDANAILAERDRFIDARIRNRISELEALPSTLSESGLVPTDPAQDEPTDTVQTDLQALLGPSTSQNQAKVRALIELKALKLREKQRQLRSLVANTLLRSAPIPLNQRKQRLERERRAKSKHVEHLSVIVNHARDVQTVNSAKRQTISRLKNAVLAFHQNTEKEEKLRIERVAKERIRALKNNDEKAYRDLVDEAKDTRITHLLNQTDTFLSSLASAVRQQQAENGPAPQVAASESVFGGVAVMPEENKGNDNDYYAIAHRISETVTRQPSILVGGTLKDYQIKGLQWLGKTIQTISLITFLIEIKRQPGPYLVIVPLSTMTNWSGEFSKWAPSISVISYKGNPTQRKSLQNELRVGNFQVLLTTYEYIIKDRPILAKFKWLHLIMGMAFSQVTLTTFYTSRFRLLLTGTPLQNNLPELWALLNFVLPKVFNSVASFDDWFNTPFANAGTGDKIELNEEEQLLIIRRLHKVLRPFLLRRLKKDVETELPDKVERVVKVRMSALQSQLYKQMKKFKMIADGGDGRNGKPAGVKGLSNELMQLRKIVQHPFLFEAVEDRMNPGGMIDEKLVRTSGKLELLHKILPKFFRTNHRVLIFFQMTKVMDIMEDFLKFMGMAIFETEERANYVQLWNASESEYKVFILSTRAGGLGLNLQTADTVIIFDSDWNPHADLQAQDRAHRIGQTRAVLILRFITEKSVEEAMYQRARYKLDIDGKVIQAGRFDNKSTQQEQEELLREQNAAQRWYAAGNSGPPPAPLIQLDELPECYRSDEPFGNLNDPVDVEIEGRGQRKRTTVSYTDGLDDDEWARALEEGEDLYELSLNKRKRGRGLLGGDDFGSGFDSGRATPMSDDSRMGGNGGRKKGKARGRPGGASDFDFSGSATPNGGKRKRGGAAKSSSVTPSLMDEDDDDRDTKRRKTKAPDVPPAVRSQMKAAFNACIQAVEACADRDGRLRCELFREVPDRRDYPDYYLLIRQPIALAQIRKRSNGNYYKDVQQCRSDWALMFNNAKTYNQEGSWVYVDAEEMEKALNEAWQRHIVGSGLPGAGGNSSSLSSSGMYGGGYGGGSSSLGYGGGGMDDDDVVIPLSRSGKGRRQVVSDDEYLTPSDE